MTNMNTTLNLKNIPKIVGIHGKKMFNECMGILNYTRWPIYISGPSGSGKSIIAMNLAKKYAQDNNVPAYYVQLSPEQTKTSLILGLRLENGSLVVKNGVVADCMEKGGIIIVDEATHSMQEVLLMFNSILDRTSVTAIGDKIIYAHENFRIVFCSNTSQYAGNIKLPQSFAQRLVAFNFDYPEFEDEVEITKKIVDDEMNLEFDLPDVMVKYIVNLMREIRSEQFPLSVRNAAIATVMLNIEYDEELANNVIINDYFTNGTMVELIRKNIAKKIFNCDIRDISALNGEEVTTFTKVVSHIGLERFKEIILQSFMYYLDIDLGFYDIEQTREKLKNSIV